MNCRAALKAKKKSDALSIFRSRAKAINYPICCGQSNGQPTLHKSRIIVNCEIYNSNLSRQFRTVNGKYMTFPLVCE